MSQNSRGRLEGVEDLHAKYTIASKYIYADNQDDIVTLTDEEREFYNTVKRAMTDNNPTRLQDYLKNITSAITDERRFSSVFMNTGTSELWNTLRFDAKNAKQWPIFINTIASLKHNELSIEQLIIITNVLLFLLRTTRRAIFITKALSNDVNANRTKQTSIASHLMDVYMYVSAYVDMIVKNDVASNKTSLTSQLEAIVKEHGDVIAGEAQRYIKELAKKGGQLDKDYVRELEEFARKAQAIKDIVTLHGHVKRASTLPYFKPHGRLLKDEDAVEGALLLKTSTELGIDATSYKLDVATWVPYADLHEQITRIINGLQQMNDIQRNTTNFRNVISSCSTPTSRITLNQYISGIRSTIQTHSIELSNKICRGNSDRCTRFDNEATKIIKNLQDLEEQIGNTRKQSSKSTSKALLGNVLSYARTLDSLFDARIIVNFRTNGFTNSVNPSQPLENYSKLIYGKDAKLNAATISAIENKSLDFQNITSFTNGTEFGPFYKVTTNGYDLDFSNDIEQILTNEGPPLQYVYSAYGYSGSGKSYTLLNNDQGRSVFQLILKKIKDSADKNVSVSFVMYDLYGEYNDPLNTLPKDNNLFDEPAEFEKLTYFRLNGEHIGKEQVLLHGNARVADVTVPIIHKSTINDFGIQKVMSIYKRINDYREVTNFADNSDTKEYHIRATPNNPQSSRSHFFIDIYIHAREKFLGKVTIMDMGGSEDVDAIEKNYFYTVSDIPTTSVKGAQALSVILSSKYFARSYVQQLSSQVKTKQSKTNEQSYQQSYIQNLNNINDEDMRKEQIQLAKDNRVLWMASKLTENNALLVDEIIKRITGLIPTIDTIQYALIVHKNWYQLLSKYDIDGDRQMTIQASKFLILFNVTSILESMAQFVKDIDKICDIFNKLFFKTMKDEKPFKIRNLHKMSWTTLYNENTQDIINKSVLTMVDGFMNPYYEIGKTFIDSTNKSNQKNVVVKTIIKSIVASTYTTMHEAIGNIKIKLLNEVKNTISGLKGLHSLDTLKGNLQDLSAVEFLAYNLFSDAKDETKFNEVIETLTQDVEKRKADQAAAKPTEQYREPKDLFAETMDGYRQLMEKHHRPLRRQGNYINSTIQDMLKYAENVSSYDHSKSKTSVIRSLRKCNVCPTSSDDLSHTTKLVLMTNIRLDFDGTINIILPLNIPQLEANQRAIKYAIRAGYDQSLEFAHCANPFKQTTDNHYKCTLTEGTTTLTRQEGLR